MKVHVYGVEMTDALREYAERKIGRIGEWLGGEALAHVRLTVQGKKPVHTAEVMLEAGELRLRAEHRSSDMYETIDLVADKLERKYRKLKEKIHGRLRHAKSLRAYVEEAGSGAVATEEDEEFFDVARVKHISLKPETLQEAILQLNMLDHDFHLFLDSDTNRAGVVYRRSDNTYGYIRT